MLELVTSEKELVKVYKFLNKVENTNLPKLKKFIKSTANSGIYALKIKDKLIGALYIQDMGTHISLTNIYIQDNKRNGKYIFEIYRQIIAYRKNTGNKRVFAMIYNITDEYSRFVKKIKDNLYEIRVPTE